MTSSTRCILHWLSPFVGQLFMRCLYSRISNLVEGFHRGFKYESTESVPRLTVQKYFWAVREELVNTDLYLGRLTVGLTSINLLNIQL